MNRSIRRAALAAALGLALAGSANAQSIWAGGSANWSSDLSPGWNGTGVPNAVGVTASNPANTTGTTTLDAVGGAIVGTLNFNSTTNTSWTIVPTTTLTFNQVDPGVGTATISNSNANTGAANALILDPGTITLADNLLISNTGGSTNATGAIQIASTIDGTGNITLANNSTTVAQAGSIRFVTGVNTFTGNVLVQKGSTSFNLGSAFGNVATNVITLGETGQGNAALFSTASGITIPNNVIVAAGSGGTLTLGSTSTAATTSVTYSGTVALNGNLNLTSVTGFNATQGFVTLSGTISGSGALTKVGTGFAQLSGSTANTFNGLTTVSAGVLRLAKSGTANAIGGNLTITGGAVSFVAGTQDQIPNTADVVMSGGVLNSTTAFNTGAVAMQETINSLTMTGSSGYATGGNSGTGWTITNAFSITGGTGARFLVNSGGRITVGSLSLTGMTAQPGATPDTANSFAIYGAQSSQSIMTVGSGGIALNNSILSLRRGGTGNAGSKLVLNGNVTVAGSSLSSIIEDTAGGTIGTRNLELSSTAGSHVRTITTAAGGADLTIGVPILNGTATTAGITKAGLGTLTLSSDLNAYNGTTTISAGVLAVTGSGVLGTGNVIVNSTLDISGITAANYTLGTAQILSGDGTINATGKTLIVSGTLAPGNSPGSLDVTGNFNLTGTSISNFEITGSALGQYDQLIATGDLVYGGALNINTTQVTGLYDLFASATTSGSFSSVALSGAFNGSLVNSLGVWTGTDGLNQATFVQATGDLTFAVIPEPSTLVLGGLALLGLGGMNLRRRRMAR